MISCSTKESEYCSAASGPDDDQDLVPHHMTAVVPSKAACNYFPHNVVHIGNGVEFGGSIGKSLGDLEQMILFSLISLGEDASA